MTNERDNIKNIDPTENVLKLVEEAVKRLDDISALKFDSLKREMDLHKHYSKELREAESKRIDANRGFDMAAVGSANERASVQAGILAKDLALGFETIRQSIVTALSPLGERLSLVEKFQHENQGKGAGINQFIGWIVAAVAVIGFLIKLYSEK